MKPQRANKIIINEIGSDLEITLRPSRNLVIGISQIVMFIGFLSLFISGIKNLILRNQVGFDEVTLFYFFFIGITFLGAINRFNLIYNIFIKIESLRVSDEFVTISKNSWFRTNEKKIRISDIESFSIKNFEDFKTGEHQVQFLNFSDLYFQLKNKKINVFEFKYFNILFEISKILQSKGLKFDKNKS